MGNLIEKFRLWLRDDIFHYNYNKYEEARIYRITHPFDELIALIKIIFHIAIIVIALWIIICIIRFIIFIIRSIITGDYKNYSSSTSTYNAYTSIEEDKPKKVPFNNALYDKANFLLTIVKESDSRYNYYDINDLCTNIELTLSNLDTEDGIYDMERYCDELRYLLIYDYRELITMKSPTGIKWLMTSR